MGEGRGNCLKYLNRGWNRTEGRGHKDFKKVERARKATHRGDLAQSMST